MKGNLFRIFLVASTVMAVVMMAVALSVFLVRPDLTSEMNTAAMQRYNFAVTTGENPQWTVTQRFGEKKSVGSFASPYQALIKAHDDLKRTLDAETSTMTAEKSDLDQKTTQISAAQEQDEQAITILVHQLGGRPADHPEGASEGAVQQMENFLLTLSGQLQGLSVKSREIRDETAERRTDVLRLRHELEEARTDLFRLSEIRRDLTDRLVRLQIENQELNDRQAQVSGKPSSYD